MDEGPDEGEVVVVEISSALPVASGHWLVQQQHQGQEEGERRGALHQLIIIRLALSHSLKAALLKRITI